MPYALGMDMHLLWYVLAGILIVLGLAGTILPALPGLPLVFIGMLVAAWAGDFKEISWVTIIVLALLTLVSIGVDIAATALGAKRVGAGKAAMFGAALGTLVGAFVLPPLGLIVGPFLGAMIAELVLGREFAHASRVGFGTWVGLAVGTALKIGLAFAMLGIFLFAMFWP